VLAPSCGEIHLDRVPRRVVVLDRDVEADCPVRHHVRLAPPAESEAFVRFGESFLEVNNEIGRGDADREIDVLRSPRALAEAELHCHTALDHVRRYLTITIGAQQHAAEHEVGDPQPGACLWNLLLRGERADERAQRLRLCALRFRANRFGSLTLGRPLAISHSWTR